MSKGIINGKRQKRRKHREYSDDYHPHPSIYSAAAARSKELAASLIISAMAHRGVRMP